MQRTAFQLTLFRQLESAPRLQQIPIRWDSGPGGGLLVQTESDAPLPERHPLEDQPAVFVSKILSRILAAEYAEDHCGIFCGCYRIAFTVVYNSFYFGSANVAAIEEKVWASPLGKKYKRAERLRLEFLSQLNPKKRPGKVDRLSKEAIA